MSDDPAIIIDPVRTRREQIERAAGALFSQRGYPATSMRDIARQVDLQGGSLYAHIAAKEDLLWAIVMRAADAFAGEVEPIAPSAGPAPERLRAMIRAHLRVLVSQLSSATVFFQDWQHLSEPRRSEVLRRRDDYEALFRRVIAEGVASGELATPDPRLAAIYLLSALNGVAGWYRPSGTWSADDVADAYADLLLDGLLTTTGATI